MRYMPPGLLPLRLPAHRHFGPPPCDAPRPAARRWCREQKEAQAWRGRGVGRQGATRAGDARAREQARRDAREWDIVVRAPALPPRSMVLYRPIEAAIRWSGLTQHEPYILEFLKGRRIPEPGDFPQWPTLRRNAERIYDGILNKELPVAINGITVQGGAGANLDDPNVTIRHVDLKDWMCRFYPSHRPPFLFSRLERKANPGISRDAVQALFLEREGLRLRIAQ